MAIMHAAGPFSVTLTPLESAAPAQAAGINRMAIAKEFHGDLEAISAGEMIAAQSTVKGSAGYVAMERVTGSLHGQHGSFVLQHSGTMNRGEPRLSVTVVPDSGRGDLAGISGTMTIIVADGAHSYRFEYEIAGR